MKRYKIQISQEVTNGSDNSFFKRSREESIFQIILEEKDFDFKGTLRKIVSGQITEVVNK